MSRGEVPSPAPHSLEAERAVLGAILLEPGILPRAIEAVTAGEFYKDAHGTIYGAMLRLSERSEPADLLAVTEELKRVGELEEVGGPAALATLVEEATVATQFASYLRILIDYAQKRTIARVCEAARDAALNSGRPETILETLRAQLPQPTAARVGEAWPLHDGAEPWEFPAIVDLIEWLMPATGIVWWGGLPKRYKSLFALYISLAIACRRSAVAKKFLVRAFPKILYVSREDGGPRLQDRRDDILSAWTERPEPGAIVFVIRPRLDLLDPEHVAWLRETCLKLGTTMLVLDTWTALSPSADPLGTKDQAQLAAVVVRLAEDINGLVVVVDHSRKNRPDGLPLSSADIFGPPQKWAAAEHIVMLDVTSDGRRLEVFVEGKDLETRRFFLTVSPRGSGGEKFVYAGTVDELADAQRAIGDQNRQAVLDTLLANPSGLSTGEIVEALKAAGATLGQDAVTRHCKALVAVGRALAAGQGRATRYVAITGPPHPPCADDAEIREAEDE